MRAVLILAADAAFGRDLEESVSAAGYAVRAQSRVSRRRGPDEVAPVDIAIVASEFAATEGDVERLLANEPRARLLVVGRPIEAARALALRQRADVTFLRTPFAIDELESALARAGSEADPVDSWVGSDPGMRSVLRAADAAAVTDATVLIVAENGSGATHLARRIHARSGRADGCLHEIDCATLGPESGVRGLERAWAANRAEEPSGALLLEHVDELAPDLARPLLALWSGGIGALGAVPPPRASSPRILATARRALAAGLDRGGASQELAYRFEVIVLRLPPLRNRPLDIAPLARHLLRAAALRAGVEEPWLGSEALDDLAAHAFPGNVAELASLMERAALLYAGAEVDGKALLGGASAERGAFVAHTLNLRDLEEVAIRRSLVETGGNRSRASETLGISVRTLRNKIRLYGLADVGRQI